MALTQKRVKEIIAHTEKILEDTVEEKEDLLKEMATTVYTEEEKIEKSDDWLGYQQTIQNLTGQLMAYQNVLTEMKK